MKLKIEYMAPDKLEPYANNAKIHTDKQIEQIRRSIEEFGFNDPVAIWKNNEIIEGHGRLLAAMRIEGLDKVPVIRLDELTDDQRKAYILVHNKLTMNTGFSLDALRQELDNITTFNMSEYGFDLESEAAEIDTDSMVADSAIICPRCGHVIGGGADA